MDAITYRILSQSNSTQASFPICSRLIKTLQKHFTALYFFSLSFPLLSSWPFFTRHFRMKIVHFFLKTYSPFSFMDSMLSWVMWISVSQYSIGLLLFSSFLICRIVLRTDFSVQILLLKRVFVSS